MVLSELMATTASLNRVSTVLLGLLLCSFLGASQLPVVFRGSGVEKGDSFWNRMSVPKPRNKFCLLFTKIQIGFLELSKSKVTGLRYFKIKNVNPMIVLSVPSKGLKSTIFWSVAPCMVLEAIIFAFHD